MSLTAEQLYAQEPQLKKLVSACQNELGAVQVWLFGSRARGDNHEHSDWDVLAVLANEDDIDRATPPALWGVRRRIGLNSDLLAVTKDEFEEEQDCFTSISYAAAHEGILLT